MRWRFRLGKEYAGSVLAEGFTRRGKDKIQRARKEHEGWEVVFETLQEVGVYITEYLLLKTKYVKSFSVELDAERDFVIEDLIKAA